MQEAGYIFLRVDEREEGIIIKYSDDFGVWKTLEKCKSKAACKRRLNELVKTDKYLF
ncbi:MAG: hypothetical protein LBF57_03415 [Holosporaceae bacterium]|nr:hypothetical protein [Holosporaceae bacterium]